MAEINYSQIDAQVAAFLAANQGKLAAGEKITAAGLCSIYSGIVRTILEAVSGLLGFFKPTWAQVIQILIATLDNVCAAPTPVPPTT
jgi:hypothetical protein